MMEKKRLKKYAESKPIPKLDRLDKVESEVKTLRYIINRVLEQVEK